MCAGYWKDLRSHFTSVSSYMFLAVFLFFGGSYFTRFVLAQNTNEVTEVFANTSVLMVLLFPFLTMRSMAREQQIGTDKLLLTGPLPIFSLAAAKLLACYTVFLLSLALTAIFPLLVFAGGNVTAGEVLVSYLGFALFGLAVISLGVFISSLSAHPLRAGLVTAICLIILWMTDSILPNVANPALHSLLSVFSLFGRLEEFQYGFLRISSILYMLSFAAVFLLFTCKSIGLHRENKV